ncbi:MAG: transglutaminase domain-containing protein [Bacteroidota bacterium]
MKTSLQVLFIALLGILSVEAYSLDSLNIRLLNHAKSAPDSSSRTVEDLTKYLVEATNNEFEIVEVIFYWIAENIEYDIEGYKTGKYATDYQETFTGKRGIHRTYSALFQRMCRLAKLECFVVAGYARGYDVEPRKAFTATNHVWNVVRVEGRYYYVDTVWGIGEIELAGDELEYNKDMPLNQVLTRDKVFLYSHLPADPRWQLQDFVIQMDDFMKLRGFDEPSPSEVYHNFRDSIAHFSSLSKDEKMDLSYKSADRFYRTNDNLKKWGHHLYNRAHKKSIGKVEREDLEASNRLYKKALVVYEKLRESDTTISVWIQRANEGMEYNQYYLRRMKK